MLLDGRVKTTPALGSDCGQCEWKRSCKEQCIHSRCLSLITELGRAKKEALTGLFATIDDLARADLANLVDSKGNTGIRGIRQPTLEKFIRRARLLTDPDARPLILQPLVWPSRSIELFFDIEADPTRDLVYLHGVIERRDADPTTDRFHAFVARETTAAAEEQAWAEFWAYIRSMPPRSFTVYYCSPYENTQYRRLAEKYPDIATTDDVADFFDQEQAIDLCY